MRNAFTTYLAGTALIAMVAPASAQTAPDPAAPSASSDEIVVTAQRRTERLADVPMTVTALAGEQLTGNAIVSSNDLTAIVPGLLWGRSTNFNQPTIRGIGSRNGSAGDEPNVATFIDGVYQPDSIGTLFELSNVEQIEVLKGPQGTLFGRNATGGAINIRTRKPSFDWNGSVSATYGRFDYYKAAGYISGPLVEDKVAMSLSAAKFGDKGYIRNVFLNRRQGEYDGTVVRGKLLFQPTPELSFQVNGLYTRTFTNVLLSTYSLNANNAARLRLASPAFNPNNLPAGIVIADQPYTTSSAFVPVLRTRQWMVDIHMDWDLGFATLSGLGSIAHTRARNLSTVEASAFQLSKTDYLSKSPSKNLEFVLTSNEAGTIDWLLGVTGFWADGGFDPVTSTSRNATTGAFVPVNFAYGLNTRAIAAFGEVTWQPTERLFLTGGLRYNRDHRYGYNISGTGVRIANDKVWSNVSPRGVIRYEFAESSNVYASYTKGFKSGVYNATTAIGAQIPVNPEIVDAYEVGLKTRLAPGVRAEVSAYHYDYDGLQISSAILFGNPPISTTTVQNAGKAKIDGVEATFEAKLSDALRVNAGLSWIARAKIQDFPNAVVQLPLTTNGVPNNNGNANATINASGNRLLRAPKKTFNLGINYEQPLFGGLIAVSGNAFFSDKYYADIANIVVQPGYEVVNGSVTWRAEKGKGFYATVFAQNLTGQKYAVGFITTANATATQTNKPRWFGITLGYDF